MHPRGTNFVPAQLTTGLLHTFAKVGEGTAEDSKRKLALRTDTIKGIGDKMLQHSGCWRNAVVVAT